MSTARFPPPSVQEILTELRNAASNPTVRFAGFGNALQLLAAHLQAQAALVADLQRRVAELERRR